MSGEDKIRGMYQKHQGKCHRAGRSQTGPLKSQDLKMRKKGIGSEEHKVRVGMIQSPEHRLIWE